MNKVLDYTNKLIKEMSKQEIEEFNSQRKSLLDAWKGHHKYLGTFDWDNQDPKLSKDGLLLRNK